MNRGGETKLLEDANIFPNHNELPLNLSLAREADFLKVNNEVIESNKDLDESKEIFSYSSD